MHQDGWGRVTRALLALVCLAVVLGCVVGAGVLRTGGNVLSAFRADLSQVYAGWRHFAVEWISRGYFPAWNPHHFCGTPFAANPEAALFYPPNLIYLVLPLTWAINASILGHLLLAGMMTWWCTRRLGLSFVPALLAGLSYMLASQNFFRLQAGHVSNLSSFPWLPLAFVATEECCQRKDWRPAAGGALALGLMILAGNLQYTYFGALFLACYAVFRLLLNFQHTAPVRLGVMVLLGAGLAGIQLALTAGILPESSRHVLPQQYAGGYSLPVAHLVNFCVPGLFGPGPWVPYWGKGLEWEYGAYTGILTLAFALLAAYWSVRPPVAIPRTQLMIARPLALAGAVCLLLALGRYTPVFPVLEALVPGFALLRGFAKFLVPTSLALALLGAIGLEWALAVARVDRPAVIRSMAVVVGILMAVVIGIHIQVVHRMDLRTWLASATDGSEPNPFAQLMTEGLWPFMRLQATFAAVIVLFCLNAGMAGLLVATRFPRIRRPCLGLLLLAASLDLGNAGLWSVGAFPSRLLDPPGEIAGTRGAEARECRVRLLRPADRESMAELGGFLSPIGSEALYPDRLVRAFNALNGKAFEEGTLVLSEEFPSRAGPVVGLRYILRSNQCEYHPTGARLHLFHAGLFCRTQKEMWQALARTNWEFERELLLFDPSGAATPGAFEMPPDANGVAHVIDENPGQLVISSQSRTPAVLYVADTFASGWSATLDGQPVTILVANYGFRAVHVPAGRHTVIFRYAAPGLRIGVAISLMSLLVCLVLFRLPVRSGSGSPRP